ncbi:MAG: phosphoribosyltransferase family protein [Crocinitomicaceae bacterium]
MQLILNKDEIEQKINRLAHQIIENSFEEKKIFIGGISGNGYKIAQKLCSIISDNTEQDLHLFEINLNKDEPWASPIQLSVTKENLKHGYILLIDDVINSGKTMQYALIKLLEQATKAIKTVALVDRMHRRYPIKADFVGLSLSTTLKERVEVLEQNDKFKAFLK